MSLIHRNLGIALAAMTFLAACGDDTLNECGGTGALRDGDVEVELGESCGACGDGIYVCALDGVMCLDASEATSACGGCGIDIGTLGESCGCGGEWSCDDDGAMVCSTADITNECGGCETLDTRSGTACTTDDEFDGVLRCTGLDTISCIPLDANGCGGTDVLAGTPASACGTCNQGVWVCDGLDAVECFEPERGINSCGGCNPLEGVPETECGICGGAWTCDADGEAVACVVDAPNECGGCTTLDGRPGETCDDGGTRFCLGPDATACGPVGGNVCGGESTLMDDLGAACGDCNDGVFICGGPNRLVCRGASATNACGGCGFLPGVPDESCAPLGTWQCVGPELSCSFREGANACGGTEDLEGAPGDACGACDLGRLDCDGFDALICVGGEDDRALSWPDSDGDGFGDASAEPIMDCELDGRVRNDDDCNDDEEGVAPGVVELCDMVDADCDGRVDEDPEDGMDFFVDADGDGFGQPARVVRGCEGAEGLSAMGGDCNDSSPEFYPGAPELDCTDDRDLNCDGETAFIDRDGDGFAACVDCDDDPLRNPGVTERCDEIDNDCDGEVDEGPLAGAPRWYPDEDGDLFGDDDAFVFACSQPDGFLPTGGDCDDTLAFVNRGADETCAGPGRDEDCDGEVDEGSAIDAIAYYTDGDGDGFGPDASRVTSCTVIAGRVTAGGDCRDENPNIHPHTAESPRADVCDFVDNDCDGMIDGPSMVNPTTWYADVDADGFGDPDDAIDACEPDVISAAPLGRVTEAGDCNDRNRLQFTGADEVIGDGVDQDCDTHEICYVDGDMDGHGAATLATVVSPDLLCRREDGEAPDGLLSDCNDAVASVNPEAIEIVGDEIDQNCDGQELCFRDDDGDGFISDTPPPGGLIVASPDTMCRGMGFADATRPRTDCDDSDFFFGPHRPDPITTAEDEDCDGYRFDAGAVRAVSAAGTDDPSCGPPDTPCATVSYALSLPDDGWDIAISGAQNGFEMSGPRAVMGGFATNFLGDPAGRSLITSGGSVGATIRSRPAIGVRGQSLTNLEVRGGLGPEEAHASDRIAIQATGSSSAFRDATLLLDNVRVNPGDGEDATASLLNGGGSYGIVNGRFTNAEIVTTATTEFVLGQGGDGVGDGNGGPSIGIASEIALLDIDPATTFVGGAGGAPGGTATGVCSVLRDDPVPHIRCDPNRIGLPALRAEIFVSPNTTGGTGLTSAIQQADGTWTAYMKVSGFGDSTDRMEDTCEAWSQAQLLELDSPSEEARLARWLVGVDYVGTGEVRTGYLDLEHDGTFMYASGIESSYTAWGPGEPASQLNDQCTHHTIGSGIAVEWCAGDREGFGYANHMTICETARGAECVAAGTPCSDAPSGQTRSCQFVGIELGCLPDTSFTDGRLSNPPNAGRLRISATSVYEILESTGGNADDAAARCLAWGGHPVDIDDAAEQALIDGLLTENGDFRTWTGATNIASDDVFRDSAGAVQSYLPWRSASEPSNRGRGAIMSLVFTGAMGMSPEDATLTSSEWRAAPAYDQDVPFVCEVDLN